MLYMKTNFLQIDFICFIWPVNWNKKQLSIWGNFFFLQCSPLFCRVIIFYVCGLFSTASFIYFSWSRFPCIFQQPQSFFEGAHFILNVGFNEFHSIRCWCAVIHHHWSQGPTLMDFVCVGLSVHRHRTSCFKSHPKRPVNVQLIPYPKKLPKNKHRERKSNLCPDFRALQYEETIFRSQKSSYSKSCSSPLPDEGFIKLLNYLRKLSFPVLFPGNEMFITFNIHKFWVWT